MTDVLVREPVASDAPGPPPANRRWWVVLVTVLAVVALIAAIVTFAGGGDEKPLPATPRNAAEVPFSAQVVTVTDAKALAQDVPGAETWTRVESIVYRDPSHWRRVMLRDTNDPSGEDMTGNWTVTGPRFTGSYDARTKVVAVSHTNEFTARERRQAVMNWFDTRYTSDWRDCREPTRARLLGRDVARYDCAGGNIPSEGLLPGSRAQVWIDVETGFILRTQWPNGSGMRVTRFAVRPSIPASVSRITVPDGAKATWAGVGPPPAQYRPRNVDVSSTIELGGMPARIVTGAGAVWVTDGEGRVLRIDPATGEIVARIELPQQLYKWPPEPDQPVRSADRVVVAEGNVWVTDAAGYLYRIDPGRNAIAGAPLEVRALPPAGTQPFYPMSMVAGEGSVWIARSDPTLVQRGGVEVGNVLGSLVRVDSSTGEPVATIAIEGSPGGMAYSGGALWLAASVINATNPRGPSTQVVYRIDPATNAISGQVRLEGADGDAFSFPLVAGTDDVWAIVGSRYFRIDAASSKVLLTVDGPAAAAGVRTANALWVATGETTVAAIDPVDGHVIKTQTTGTGASAISFGFGSLWVVNSTDRTIARISE